MIYPVLREVETTRTMQTVFGGYNHNLRIGESEFYRMTNLVGDLYPLLSPRKPRGLHAETSDCSGMISKDALLYIDGRYVYFNGLRLDIGLSDAAGMKPKRLVSMGAYVIVLPDKVYLNTQDVSDYGPIEASFTTETDAEITLSTLDGGDYEGVQVGISEPAEPSNLAYWLDTGVVPNVLKQYSSSSSMWVQVPTTYVRISSPGIGAAFEQYDGVQISGIEAEELSDLNGNMVVMARDTDYIVVTGIIAEAVTQTADEPITVSRRMPNMDFVIEGQNRLWGCRYGVALNGEVVNEIYACKLGDFKNWSCFMGLASDSYAASVGSDGVFTGAITHLNQPIFFKENCLHKVYGNYPSNYQIQDTECRGVQQGCADSLAVVNEVLLYKSRIGVMAYDGSLPANVSYALGDVRYSDAVAAGYDGKYYISMHDDLGEWSLFTYDVRRDVWHRHDDLQVKSWCACRNDLFYIDAADGYIHTIYANEGAPMEDAGEIAWSAETGEIALETPDKKYIQRITIRASIENGAEFSVDVEYDSSGKFEHIRRIVGSSLRTYSIPVLPKRCDHMRLRIRGVGSVRIYGIAKTIETGSDLR